MWPVSSAELAKWSGGSHAPAPTTVTSVTADSRNIVPGALFVALPGARADGHVYAEQALAQGASLALVRDTWEGLSRCGQRCLGVHDPLTALRSIAAQFRRRLACPVVAIGGSNGKTTTKEMLAALLAGSGVPTATRRSENGWLGIPLTLLQERHREPLPSFVIVEIGIDAPGAMAAHAALTAPDVAVLTALGPEHLEGLGTWERAREEELLLLRSLPPGRPRVWQTEDPYLAQAARQEARPGDIIVGTSPPAIPGVQGLQWELLHQDPASTTVSFAGGLPWTVPLPGAHNAGNFAASMGVALALGVQESSLRQGWTRFVPPEKRSRVRGLSGGGALIDDTYNAGPSSMEAALSSLEVGPWRSMEKVLVLGDMLELGQESTAWHVRLGEAVARLERVRLFLVGTEVQALLAALPPGFPVTYLGPQVDLPSALSQIPLSVPAVYLLKASRGVNLSPLADGLWDALLTRDTRQP